MNKERVIVFNGEDKFIAPNPLKKAREAAEKLSPEGDYFKQYMLKQNAPIVIPNPSDADFCAKAEAFIKTRCEGRATTEEVWKVYELFQKFCVKAKEEEAKAEGEQPKPADITPEPIKFPDWETLDCETIAAEIKNLENTLLTAKFSIDIIDQYKAAIEKGKDAQIRRCGINPPALPVETPTSTPTTPASPNYISLSTPKLGQPPATTAATTEDNTKPKEKKGNQNLLIFLALGLVALYFVTKKSE